MLPFANKWSVYFEKYTPLAISVVTIGSLYLYRAQVPNFGTVFDQIVTNSLAVSGTLIGFYLTILTMLQTITTRRMKFLREANLMPRLLLFLNITILGHLLTITIGLFLPFFKQLLFLKAFAIYGKFAILFCIVFTWMLSIRFTYFFVKLLHDPK